MVRYGHVFKAKEVPKNTNSILTVEEKLSWREVHDFHLQMIFFDRKRIIGRQIYKKVALIKLKTSDPHDVNLNSAQRSPRLGVCGAQKNPSPGLSLPRDVSNLGSTTQVLASLCQDLASGKSLNQALWALGVRNGII